jgi:hypothetical protein
VIGLSDRSSAFGAGLSMAGAVYFSRVPFD